MALVDCAPFIWPGSSYSRGAGGPTTMATCDANGEKGAFAGLIPLTGTIDRVGLLLSAVTNANAATQITVSLQTLDASGNPSGTLLDAANGQWQKTGSGIVATGWNWFDFTGADGNGAASVNRSTPFAVVLEMTVRGGTDTLNVNGVGVSTQGRNVLPYGLAYVSSWGKSITEAPNFVLEYASASYVAAPYFHGITAIGTIDSNLEKGVRFQFPFPARASGLIDGRLYSQFTGQTNYQAHLIADATAPGGTRLASTPDLDSDISSNPTTASVGHGLLFQTPCTLAKDTWYRLTRTGTGHQGRLYYGDVPSNAALKQLLGTTDFYYTVDNGAGGWTDTTTRTTFMGLIIDQIDDGAGGAGGMIVHPGMVGGMRG